MLSQTLNRLTNWRHERSGILNKTEQLNDDGFAYLLLLPIFTIFTVIAIWPILRTFEMSLHADVVVGSGLVGEFVGLQNYVEVLTGARDPILSQPFFDLNQPFNSAITVTIILTVLNVSFSVMFGFAQALIMDQEFRGRRWVRLAVLIPWSVPIVIQGMIFFLMFNPGIGFAVEPLHNLGLISQIPLQTTQDSILIIVIANIWKTSTFVALLVLAALQSIDRSLYDVAKVAGATRWQQFRMISLPLVMPTLYIVLLFRTIMALKIYGIIETVSTCQTVPSLTCMVVSSFSSQRYGTSSTIAFITAFVIGVLVSFYILKFVRNQSDAQGGI